MHKRKTQVVGAQYAVNWFALREYDTFVPIEKYDCQCQFLLKLSKSSHARKIGSHLFRGSGSVQISYFDSTIRHRGNK